ncbi:hypothetical protein B0H19DRAFT_1142308 [Mycena capillaripes]|nr:hypothetical protein B0H19DRAFT_1142308 [Mycena capillaripes]
MDPTRTPFSDILHTNIVPNDAQRQHIYDLLVGPLKEAVDLAEEILRLTAKRDKLSEFIDPHLALVSPVRSLPDDILREILIASLPSCQNATLNPAESPLLLCHISRRWRNLALSTPLLWTSLHITLPPIKNSRAAKSPRLGEINDAAKAWISRSGLLPLSLSFVVQRSEHYDIAALSSTFIQCSYRWRAIRLDLPELKLFTGFLALTSVDVPMLRSAIVSGFDGTSSTAKRLGFPQLLSFLGRPSLRSLSFLNGHYGGLPTNLDALQHLTLRTAGFSSRDALDVLHQCPNLESCTLSISKFIPASPRSCCMEKLQRLSVTDYFVADFMQFLFLPNLRCLEYRYDGFQDWGHAFLPCFSVFRSAERLESLHLRVRSMSTTVLIEGLRLIPTLRELVLFGEPPRTNPPVIPTESRFSESEASLVPLMTSATPTEADSIPAPRLRSITLLHFRAVSDAALLAFLLARTDPRLPASDRLTHARIQLNRLPDTDNIMLDTSLQRRIAYGLDLVLGYDLPRATPYAVENQRDSHDWDPISTDWMSDTLI